jgi:hypothetical protein
MKATSPASLIVAQGRPLTPSELIETELSGVGSMSVDNTTARTLTVPSAVAFQHTSALPAAAQRNIGTRTILYLLEGHPAEHGWRQFTPRLANPTSEFMGSGFTAQKDPTASRTGSKGDATGPLAF